MPTNFSTITPLSTSTISKKPAFSVNNQQPAASSPVNTFEAEPKKKNNHWFLKTLATVAVVAAAVGLGRKYLPEIFNPAATLNGTENLLQKGLHYAKVYIGKAGECVNSTVSAGINFVRNLFTKKPE